MHPAIPIVVAIAIALGIPPVLAHGDSGHGRPKAVDYSTAEETPFGRPGDPKRIDRTIHVGMHDTMRFVAAPLKSATDARAGSPPHAMPADLVVKKGETVRFVVRNDGTLMHEMVIGTMRELKEHAELMRKHPGMEHDEPYMTHVGPGKRGEIVWQFTRPGEFHYACLIPGHLEAGMIAKITVK